MPLKKELMNIWKSVYSEDYSPLEISSYLFQHVSAQGTDCIYTFDFWNRFLNISKESDSVSRLSSSASSNPSFSFSFFPRKNHIMTLYSLDNSETGLILIHADASAEFNAISVYSTRIILTELFALAAYCIICSMSVRKILRPFLQMNHSVKCYSKGDFSKRLPVDGHDEATQLAISFNEMAEQLRDMENTRRSFVANVSHELRSPLTSIKGFLEAMKDGTIPPEEHEAYLDIVLSETRRMNLMVNDLLDLARIESGIITVNYSIFDINELIRRILITFETRISELDIELDIRFSSDNCYVNADFNQISQVLRNLIDNAIKYSGNGKYLMLSTYTIKKVVYIAVKDNGDGIPPDDVPHVFDRFYKVEKAHTPSPQVGSGLGLSIVKKIIEAHGQTITVKSGRGRGTQFTFTLEKAAPIRINTRSMKS